MFVRLENVALHNAAWQQNPSLNNQYNASLAVDGRKENLSPWGGECVLSGRSKMAEWQVDLKSVLSIHHILIQYAQNNHVWGMYLCFLLYLPLIDICIHVFLFSFNFIVLRVWVFILTWIHITVKVCIAYSCKCMRKRNKS